MDINNTDTQIFMVGRGGQGILVLARALSEIAFKKGRRLITSETHGMAMRGGTVTASLKIGKFASPLIPAGCADILIGLEQNDARDYLHMLKPGGITIVNTEDRNDFTYSVDASGIALNQGLKGSANMIMLGFVIRYINTDFYDACAVMESISPKRVLDKNIKALEIGFETASNEKYNQSH